MYRYELIEELLDMNITFVRINKMINRKTPSEEEYSLAPTQMMALTVLKNQPPVNMTQLSELLDIPRQQLTKVIDALVSKGLVKRYTAPDNRKVVMVEITQKGRDCLHNLFFDAKSRLSKFLDFLSERQREDFMEALSTFKRIMSEIEAEYRINGPVLD